MKKEKKTLAWICVDKNENNRLICDFRGKYHIFKTRKLANKFVDELFFDAKEMGWRIKKVYLEIKPN